MSLEPPPESLRALYDAERAPPALNESVSQTVWEGLDAQLSGPGGGSPPSVGGSGWPGAAMGTLLFVGGALVGAAMHAWWSSPQTEERVATPTATASPAPVDTPVETPVETAASSAASPAVEAEIGSTDRSADGPASHEEAVRERPPHPPAQRRSSRRTNPSASDREPPPTATPEPDTLREERQQLDAARAALSRGGAQRALARLDHHARTFPRGQLAEEREALRVRALSTLGRTEAAETAATQFLQRFPESVFARSVRAGARSAAP